MGWIANKLDSLAGTIIAVVTGVTSLQVPAFMHAYLQRLGGHLDEARLGLAAIKSGQVGSSIDEAVLRERLTIASQERVAYLETAQSAITDAGPFTKPVSFVAHMDNDIALATLHAFTPSLPLDVPSLVFAMVGIILGWLVWAAIKSPARLLRRKRKGIRRA